MISFYFPDIQQRFPIPDFQTSNKLWHTGLMNKFSCYFVTWSKSFPSDQFITIFADAQNYSFHYVNGSVPHRSVLAPTLLSFHINHWFSSFPVTFQFTPMTYTLHARIQPMSQLQIIQLDLQSL